MMRWMPMTCALAFACTPHIPRGTVPVEQARALPRVVVQTDAASPNVYLQASVRAGSGFDPVGSEGLAHLVASAMVEGGAGARTPEQMREAMFVTGNAIEHVVGKELLTFRLRCHRDQAEACISLFTDVLVRPSFEAATVSRLREEAAYALSTGAADDEEHLAAQVLDLALFEGHPYAHPVQGRHGVVSTLDEGDVRAFYDAHFVRRSVVLGIAGAASDQQVERFVEAAYGLGDGLPPDSARLAPVPVSGRSLWVVETDSDVVGYRFGHLLDVPRSHQDYPALYLAMTAFGSHRQSFGMLFRSLRGQRGLNYGTYAYAEAFRERSGAAMQEQGVARNHSFFHLWIRPTSRQNAPFALKLALWELDQLVQDGLGEERFEDTKAYLRGAIPLLARDQGRRLAYAVEAASVGMPDPLVGLATAVESLTLAEVDEALRRHLRPADLDIIAVGGAPEELIDALLSEEPTPMIYDAENVPAEQAAIDKDVAASSLGLDRARVQVVPYGDVLR